MSNPVQEYLQAKDTADASTDPVAEYLAERDAQMGSEAPPAGAEAPSPVEDTGTGIVGAAARAAARAKPDDPFWYNKVTDPDRPVLSNVARGLAHGAVDYGALGAVDLGLAAAQIALPKGVENLVGLGTARERVADLQESFKEFVDPQGKAAGAATVVGALVGGLKPFKLLNSVGFRALAKASPAAARIVEIGLKPGASYLERLAAHAIGSGTVDAVQVVDVMSRDDLSPKEKLKQVALIAGISGASAAYAARHGGGPAPLVSETAAKEHEGDPPPPPAGGPNPDRAKEADELLAKAQEAEARQEELRRLKLEARVFWQKANPTKKWETLKKAERIKVIADYIKGEADSKAVQPLAPEPEAAPPESPAAPAAAAPPVSESPAPEPVAQPPASAEVPRYISPDDALGSNLKETVYDPGKSDATGGNEIIGNVGEKLTPEMLGKISAAGIERFETTKGHVAIESKGMSGTPIAVTNAAGETRPGTEADRVPIESKTKVGDPVTGLVHEYRMGETQKKSAPRYRSTELEFESDLDRAAYILQGATKSKAHDAILEDVKAKTGLTDRQIMEHGARVKDQLKNQITTNNPGKVRVGKVEFSDRPVGPERSPEVIKEKGTVAIFKKIKAYGLQGLVKLEDKIYPQRGSIPPEVHAEVSARTVVGWYEQFIGEGMTPEEARTRIAQIQADSKPELGTPEVADAIARNEEVPQPAAPLETPKGAEPVVEPKTAAELAKPPKEKVPKKPKGRTLEDIDKDIDKIDEDLDAKRISDAQATVRLEKLKREKIALKKSQPDVAASEKAKIQAVAKGKLPDTIGQDLSKFSAEELANTKRAIKSLINLPENASHKEELIAEFSRISDFEAARDRPPGGPIVLNMSPATVGGAVGFVSGITQGNDDQERMKNALYYMAVGAAAGYGAGRYFTSAAHKAVPEYQQDIRKTVKSIEDGPIEERKGIMTLLRRNYEGIVRRTYGIERANKAIGLGKASFFNNAGKMAELFGLYKHMADSWIFDKPRYWDDNSELINLDAEGIRTIANVAGGDTRTVGDLMAAKRTMELASGMKPRRTGIDLVAATRMIANANEAVHQAAEMARKYAAALAQVGKFAGLLSDETVAKWDMEYYAPIVRLFQGSPGGSAAQLDVKGKGATNVAAHQPFKKLKGSTLPFQNPFEALVDMTHRVLRAAEFNRLAVKFFDGLAGADPEVRKLIGRRLEKPGEVASATFDDLTAKLLTLSEESGGKMGREEAMRIVHTMSDHTLNVTDDIIHFYRNGKRESWRVNGAVARAFRNLQGHELNAMMEGLGFADQVAQVARVGVTVNPWFILKQAFRDNWQYYMNGAYGTIPVYANLKAFFYQAKGYSHLIRNSEDVRMYRGFGGGGDNIASEGLQIIGGKLAVLDKIKAKPVNNQIELAAKQLAKMSIFEAYTTLVAPIADAGRIGAYLHERGRGATVADAVYRAKKTGANYSQKGDFAKIQALSRMTLFLNATLQSFDAAKDAFKTDPVGYITRGLVGIAMPSAYLWYASKDDQEIQEVRGTAAGKRSWPVRIAGRIVMIPKPQFDGHMFGTSVEAWLDQKYKEDPDAVHNMGSALMQDVGVNLLPVIGVVPLAISNNMDLNTGQPIVGDQLSNLDIEYQTKDQTSSLARVASKQLAPLARSMNIPAVSTAVSPVGLDYITRNLAGTLGTEIVNSVSFILDQRNGAAIPPLEELPFVSSAFANQPSLNSGSIKEFYNHATVAAQKAATLQHLATTDPQSIDTYVQANETEIGLAQMYGSVRNELADMRKALVDIDQAPRDVMSDAEKRDLTKEITQQMIDMAREANSVARAQVKEK